MKVLDNVIRWSIARRGFVLVVALAVSIYGVFAVARMPIDVFPDLTAPTVTIVTEAHGLAPEEVESLITAPIETAMNGQTQVRRVRSASGVGISIIWVEFGWGTEMVRARQLVTEKLPLAQAQLPPDVPAPQLAPVSSVMGEIMFVGLRSQAHPGHEVRDTADKTVRRRLLGVLGVAQVVPIGGGVRQYQVEVDPDRLRRHGVSLDEVAHALETSNQNSTGGFAVRGPQQNLVRGLGRLRSTEDLERVVVASREGTSITVGQVAKVQIGPAVRFGEGSVDGTQAVVMAISKQPGTNTIALTAAIDRELDAIERDLPKGMKLERQLFRQAEFIDTAVDNVAKALRDGAILVVVIIFLFLVNVRATAISAIALPISLLVAVIVLEWLDAGINTMTLGGLTIAIGALVDDAIIDVENVVRRLRENSARPEADRRPASEVIYEASREVRGSIVFATIIVMMVFIPVFFLTGVEGRLLFPLGFAYLVAIFASLIVALTVTPALCAVMLPRLSTHPHGDAFVVRGLKRGYGRALAWTLRHGRVTVIASLVMAAGAAAMIPFLGRSFLPEFNEGALTINAVTLPGTSLAESDARGRRLEKILLALPEVVSTARRTGRAELDEHAQDVNATEIEVRLRRSERSREEFLDEVRRELARVPGMSITIGQPISHRIDHMLSGTRAGIAVKLFGEDLFTMRLYAEQIRRVMEQVDGAVDVAIEQQIDIPQVVVDFDLDRVARAGTHRGELAETMEVALAGKKVTQVLEGQRMYDVVVRYPNVERDVEDLRALPIDVPGHGLLPLGMLANVRRDVGPNTIVRENTQRKMVIMANVSGRDLGSVVGDIEERVAREVQLPEGYHVVYGGQFESQERASRTLLLLGLAVIVGIFLVLQLAFDSAARALVIMANLPLALIGGVVAVFVTDRILSIGSLVGFITLFGIATRNGIMLISHYDHVREVEGASLEDAVYRGSLERLSPVLMTALCAGLALVPLVIAAGEPGNEIQAPMGVVILGGLLTSTLLNLFVVPVLYAWSSRQLEERAPASQLPP
ncbi:MAG: efflux RND transporter permease subunit [Deltaproteobacteria bacterium]|nr:efflux RND transporter permease subunit [Deltaproteobacteria bacterium]